MFVRWLVIPNGEVLKLTWPQVTYTKNIRYTSCMYLWPYETLNVLNQSDEWCGFWAASKSEARFLLQANLVAFGDLELKFWYKVFYSIVCRCWKMAPPPFLRYPQGAPSNTNLNTNTNALLTSWTYECNVFFYNGKFKWNMIAKHKRQNELNLLNCRNIWQVKYTYKYIHNTYIIHTNIIHILHWSCTKIASLLTIQMIEHI